MKRTLFAFLAIAGLCFSTGCCGWWHPWHTGYGYGGGYTYPGNPCPGGACGPSGTYAPPQGTYYSDGSVHSVQMRPVQPIDGPVTAVPADYYPGPVIHTAAMPLESLPTY